MGLVLRGLVAILVEDNHGKGGSKPQGDIGLVDLVDFPLRRQRRVIRSTFSAGLNGLVDRIEQMLVFQSTLPQIYLGIAQSLRRMIDLLEKGKMYPPLDLCIYARAVYDAIAASDACEPAGCSLKLHLIPVGDRMAHGLIRKLYWVDTRTCWQMV